MSGKHGTKESKEVLTLVKVIALAIVAEVKKDGFQPSDVGVFLKSPEFEAAIRPAVDGINLVPAELVELDFWDGLELSKYAYSVSNEILAALKGAVKPAA